MNAEKLLAALAGRKTTALALAEQAIAQPELVETLCAATAHATARVRFGATRALVALAEMSPRTLYPRFDFFAGLLGHPNRILQWEAARVLARLMAVDAAGRFDRLFHRFFAPIGGPVMITAANLIGHAPVIARARPAWADRIARQVLKVEAARYQTPECRNVAIGHAILACGELLPLLKRPGPVLEFVRRQLRNPRPSTRKKARALLARHGLPRVSSTRLGRPGNRPTSTVRKAL